MSPTTASSSSCTGTQPSVSSLSAGSNIARSENVHFKVLVASLVIGCFCIAILVSIALSCLIRRRFNPRTRQLPCSNSDPNRTTYATTAGAYWLGAIQKCQDWIDRLWQRRCQSAPPIYVCKTSNDLRTTDHMISCRDWLVQPLALPQAPPATLSTTTAGYTRPPTTTSNPKVPLPGRAAFCYSPSTYSRRSSHSSSYTLFQEDYLPTSAGLVSPI